MGSRQTGAAPYKPYRGVPPLRRDEPSVEITGMVDGLMACRMPQVKVAVRGL